MVRVLINIKPKESILIEAKYVVFDSLLCRERVRIETNKGTIYVNLPDGTLEKVQLSLLSNGYYDFREYYTDLKFFHN